MKLNLEKPEGDAWNTYVSTASTTASFHRHAAPLVFTWLEWCALLALIRFVELKTNLWPLTALSWLLGLLLWGYFMEFVSPGRADWLPRDKLLSLSTLARTLISICATAGLVSASYWFAGAIMKHPL